MRRSPGFASVLAAAAALAVLALGACTAGSPPDGSRVQESGPVETSTSAPEDRLAVQEPAVELLTDPAGESSGAASPLPRPGWEPAAAYGSCVLSWRGTLADDPPPAAPRDASEALLVATRDVDGGEPASPVRDLQLPVGTDGATVVTTNAVGQDWSVSTPRGQVQVRGAARVAVTPTFEGGAQVRTVEIVLDCPGPFDDGAWSRAMADLRVTNAGRVEEPGEWPS